MQLIFRDRPGWAPLAWLAICPRSEPVVTVHCGARVERGEQFFCEAAWAGPWDEHGFDTTEIVAGSGGRLRGDRVVFVPSGSTLDRLQVLDLGDRVLVSNSLPCLLEAADADVDPLYGRYYEDFYSIVDGLGRYRRGLATSRGTVLLACFDNLVWDGRTLATAAKPAASFGTESFAAYEEFLDGTMRMLAENLADRGRARPFRMLGTLSSGYDSTTVCALAAAYGCEQALCFDRTHLDQPDSGAEIARHLGLAPVVVDNAGWRRLEQPEIPFIAANSMGEEVRFRAAEELLDGRVLLTGYHGDKVWALDAKEVGPDLVRGDPSGSSLTEYRLWAGFLHCPVPFWGARRIAEINALGRTPEMAPWDVGGSYSRPICRRIAESRGVPRELFGQSKRNASVMLHNYEEFLTPDSAADFFRWLREHRHEWLRRGRLPLIVGPWIDRAAHAAADRLGDLVRRLPGLWRLERLVASKPVYLRRHVFPWAVDRARSHYRSDERRFSQSDAGACRHAVESS